MFVGISKIVGHILSGVGVSAIGNFFASDDDNPNDIPIMKYAILVVAGVVGFKWLKKQKVI